MSLRPAPAGTARFTLLNVLGELVRPAGGPAWTSALLEALALAGFEQAGARQAIQRVASAGWIAREQVGRDVRWQLTASGRGLVEEGIRRVEALGRAPAEWDGRWLVALVSIPQAQRGVRARLYRSLRWAGFGNPTATVWISPDAARAAWLAEAVAALGLSGSAVCFAGAAVPVGMSEPEMIARAWDLERLAQDYVSLAERFERRRPTAPAASLQALLELDAALQRLPYRDPLLPAALLPGWVGRAAAAGLLERRAAYLPGARAHWAQLSEPHTPSARSRGSALTIAGGNA